MNIGEFRHRIKLLREETYKDEWGNSLTEIKEFASLWAKVSNLHGESYLAAAALQQEKTLLITTRYYPGIEENVQIKFQDKNYDIEFIDNIKYRNEYLEIRAQLQD